MPILIVKSGPFAGQYDGLLDLIATQEERQATCKHVHTKPENGVAGIGLRKYQWSRVRCLDCRDCVDVSQRIDTPDYEQQKELDAAFWAHFDKLEKPPEDKCYRHWAIEGNFPGYGWSPVWDGHATSAQKARADYLSSWTRSNVPLRVIPVKEKPTI